MRGAAAVAAPLLEAVLSVATRRLVMAEVIAVPVMDVALVMAESVATPAAVPVAVSGCSCIVGVPVQVLWEEDSRILPQRPAGTVHKNTVLQLPR